MDVPFDGDFTVSSAEHGQADGPKRYQHGYAETPQPLATVVHAKNPAGDDHIADRRGVRIEWGGLMPPSLQIGGELFGDQHPTVVPGTAVHAAHDKVGSDGKFHDGNAGRLRLINGRRLAADQSQDNQK